MTKNEWLSMGMTPAGSPLVRVRVLSWIATLLNVQFVIGGCPYGATFDRAINHAEKRGLRRTGACSAAAEQAS